ncbi:MAG: hypothetical protein WC579_01660 [Candidatus Paceibacterota bacterium]
MITVAWEKTKIKYINAMYKEGLSVPQILAKFRGHDAGQYILKELGFEKTIEEELKRYATSALLGMEAVAPINETTLKAIYEVNKATFLKHIQFSAQEIQKELMNSMLANLDRKQMLARVMNLRDGLNQAQMETIIDTMNRTYSRQVQAVMSRDLPEDTKYVYAGPVDEKTRPICLEMMAAGEMTREEIDERFPGAFIDGGGFNCRHSWRTVTKFTEETKLSNPEKAKEEIEELKKEDKWETPKTQLQKDMEKND